MTKLNNEMAMDELDLVSGGDVMACVGVHTVIQAKEGTLEIRGTNCANGDSGITVTWQPNPKV